MKTRKKYNFKKRKTRRNIKKKRKRRKTRRGGGVSIPALGAIMAGTGVLSGLNYFLMRRRKSKKLESNKKLKPNPIYEEAPPPPDVYEDDIFRQVPPGVRKGKWLREKEKEKNRQKFERQERERQERERQRRWLEIEPHDLPDHQQPIIQRLKFNIKSMLKEEYIKYEKELITTREEFQNMSHGEMDIIRSRDVGKKISLLLAILDEHFPMSKFIIENLDKMLVEDHTPGWWWCVWSRLIGWQGNRGADRESIERSCGKMNLSEYILPDGIEIKKPDGIKKALGSYPIGRHYFEGDGILKYWNNYMNIIYKTFEKVDYTGKGLDHSKKILKGLISNVLPEEEEGRDPRLGGPAES